LASSPAVARSFPEGANSAACRMSVKRIEPKYLQSTRPSSVGPPSSQTTVFIIASSDFFVIRPCMWSVPPLPARYRPSGEKVTLCT